METTVYRNSVVRPLEHYKISKHQTEDKLQITKDSRALKCFRCHHHTLSSRQRILLHHTQNTRANPDQYRIKKQSARYVAGLTAAAVGGAKILKRPTSSRTAQIPCPPTNDDIVIPSSHAPHCRCRGCYTSPSVRDGFAEARDGACQGQK